VLGRSQNLLGLGGKWCGTGQWDSSGEHGAVTRCRLNGQRTFDGIEALLQPIEPVTGVTVASVWLGGGGETGLEGFWHGESDAVIKNIDGKLFLPNPYRNDRLRGLGVCSNVPQGNLDGAQYR